MDFQIVSGEYWEKVCQTLNGAGVQSVKEKYDELLAAKEKEVKKVKIVKPKPRQATVKKKTGNKKGGEKSSEVKKTVKKVNR